MRPDADPYNSFYDHVYSRYYDLLIRWLALPFGRERRWRERLLAPVEFTSGDRILDMCCGTGGATFAIARKAGDQAEILGVDLSSGQIAGANRKNPFGNVRFLHGDAADVPLEDGHFDKVFICHALHEMPREMRLETLTNAKRVLKPGGRVIVLDVDTPPNLLVRLLAGIWLLYWVPYNFETPTRRDMLRCGIVNELEATGFTRITKTPMCRGVFQVVVAQR